MKKLILLAILSTTIIGTAASDIFPSDIIKDSWEKVYIGMSTEELAEVLGYMWEFTKNIHKDYPNLVTIYRTRSLEDEGYYNFDYYFYDNKLEKITISSSSFSTINNILLALITHYGQPLVSYKIDGYRKAELFSEYYWWKNDKFIIELVNSFDIYNDYRELDIRIKGDKIKSEEYILPSHVFINLYPNTKYFYLP